MLIVPSVNHFVSIPFGGRFIPLANIGSLIVIVCPITFVVVPRCALRGYASDTRAFSQIIR